MKVRVECKKQFKVIGRMGSIDDDIWGTCKADPDFFDRLFRVSTFPSVGLCFGNDENGKNKYMVGAITEHGDLEGMDSYMVPESTWLVFESRGPIFPTLGDTWNQIYGEYMPSCKEYKQTKIPTMEIYWTDGDTMQEDYFVEIWIPVEAI